MNRWRMVARVIFDDSGQDLVEYALLAAFIGIAGWAVLIFDIPEAIGTAYRSWIDVDAGVPDLWAPTER